MTPTTAQQRAEEVIETWKTYDPSGFRIGHLTQLIQSAISRAHHETLDSAKRVVSDYNFEHDHGKKATKACDEIYETLDRLAKQVSP